MITLEGKRPDEVRDYQHDWSPFLGADTIVTSSWTALGVTIDSDEIDTGNTSVTLWLSGGTNGTFARLINTITTAGGRTEVENFLLHISEVAEPVSLDDAKAHLGVYHDDDDALICALIRAAREWVENHTGQVLVQRSFTDRRDDFGDYIEIRRQPVIEVTEVGYTDDSGVAQTYADFLAQVERSPARVHPALNGSWPSTWSLGGISVTYVAGYEEGLAPASLVAAIKLMIGHLYANREAVAAGITEVPFGVTALCAPYRRIML